MGLFRSKKKKSKAVVVLGSGRSGTSVLARAINIMGVDLGENFIRKNKTNPKGFFEDKLLVETHINISEYLIDRPFPKKFQKLKYVRPLRKALKEYVKETFVNKPIWGIKDPRNNDFLPMWKDILNELNVEGYYLIIIRNPVDVVASYKRAYNRDPEWARLQWQYRTLEALKETANEKRIIIEYDELFNRSLDCVRRIAKTFNFPWPEDESEIKAQLDEFIDPNLQTSKSDTALEAFKANKDVPEDIKALYLHCLEGAKSQAYLESKSYQADVDTLYKAYIKDHKKLPVVPPDAKRYQNKKKA